MTKQRQVVLDEVRAMNTHPTADDVFARVRQRLPRISLGTVYRNLDVLAGTGQVVRIEVSGSQYRFDGDTTDHYHVRCIQCDRLDDVASQRAEVSVESVQGVNGYDIVGHRLLFLGVCPACQRHEEVSREL